MIVGEAPGSEEELRGEPFVGAAGHELTKMLHEAGIQRSECFLTNVARVRPLGNDVNQFIAKAKKDRTPEHLPLRDKWVKRPLVDGYNLLIKELELVQPNIVIALGNVALWSLTGLWGITKWRGSMIHADIGGGPKVIPTLHPSSILRQWENRAIAVTDLRRAARFMNGEPYPVNNWNMVIRPSFDKAVTVLQGLAGLLETGPIEISFDLETRAGHIACAGLTWGNQGICLPFMCIEDPEGYWREDEEAELVWLLRKILTHQNAYVIGQNQLYDCQYTYRWWLFDPRVKHDTMISQHVAFAGLQKSLAFQASMYCNQYRYWKDDSKNWDPKMGEEQLWVYNLEDCFRTAEIARVHDQTIPKLNLQSVNEFQQELFWPVLYAMKRGVRIDKVARGKMALDLTEEMTKREQFFVSVLGHPLNPRSPKQMMNLFYEDLKLPVQLKRGKPGEPSRPTLDDDALTKLATKEPIVRPILKAIGEYRSIGVFLSTFVNAPLDHDDRMRCSYNICGTETYRFSSSENAFGSGTNLQNVPKGILAKDPDELSLPNIRKIFIPDPGMEFFDMDLDRADLQVVVWEADDEELKQMLREGVDIHTENAKTLGCARQMAKMWVHGTNYGGSPRTMAINCGLLVKEAERMQRRWFEAHPGIHSWHRRTETQLRTKRFVENKFGYRRYYFDRVDALLPEALAWIPQSTVACVINRAWLNIYRNLPRVEVLLQVHDSLAGQFPIADKQMMLPFLTQEARITIPYADPLIIPVGIKTSPISWGDCV